MKKFVSILIVFVMIFTLTSCANTEKPNWQDHLDLGQKYLLDGDYEQAIIEFNKVIEIEPKNVDAYLGLAEAYVAIGDYEQAIIGFNKVIEIEPNNVEAYQGSSNAYAVMGDYDSAISALEQGYAETGNHGLRDRISDLQALMTSMTETDITTLPDIIDDTEAPDKPDTAPAIIKQVSLGYDHSAAITDDGSLYMWGDNYCGQLGVSTVEDFSCNPIKTMDNVSAVSLGSNHSAAITTDGSLYIWGVNSSGQLGNGTTEVSYVPIKIMDDVASVSLGENHSAAITTDGSLYTWGDNSYGQLGNGTFESSSIPIKIMDNVASVSLGTQHSAAITTDGSLYMWGFNRSGQLGIGKNDSDPWLFYNEWDYRNTPIKVMDNVIFVSLGDNYSAAITTDGSFYMCGLNLEGELGNGTIEESFVPIKIMDNVIFTSLGEAHSAAITTGGSLYMWGENYSGELGDGLSGGIYYEYDEKIDSNIPIKIMDNVACVSLGGRHSAAITTDGSLYMWGDNEYGQLGNGTTESSNVPIKIEIPAE